MILLLKVDFVGKNFKQKLAIGYIILVSVSLFAFTDSFNKIYYQYLDKLFTPNQESLEQINQISDPSQKTKAYKKLITDSGITHRRNAGSRELRTAFQELVKLSTTESAVELGDFEERFTDLWQEDYKTHMLLGDYQLSRNNQSKALTYYETAFFLHPFSTETYHKYINLLRITNSNKSKLQIAESFFQELIIPDTFQLFFSESDYFTNEESHGLKYEYQSNKVVTMEINTDDISQWQSIKKVQSLRLDFGTQSQVSYKPIKIVFEPNQGGITKFQDWITSTDTQRTNPSTFLATGSDISIWQHNFQLDPKQIKKITIQFIPSTNNLE